jgi:hypothetical protein
MLQIPSKYKHAYTFAHEHECKKASVGDMNNLGFIKARPSINFLQPKQLFCGFWKTSYAIRSVHELEIDQTTFYSVLNANESESH